MSFDLDSLLDGWRRNKVRIRVPGEIMSVCWGGFRQAFVVIIFNSIRIFISNLLLSDRAYPTFFQELCNGKNTDVAIFISKDYLALLSFRIIEGVDESDLGAFLNTVHILPVGDQFIWGLCKVFCGDQVYAPFDVTH